MVFKAAETCGSKGIGWDIDVGLLAIAKERSEGDPRITFQWVDCMVEKTLKQLEDTLTTGGVTVLYLFILDAAIRFLEKTIIRALESNPSLRVVTRRFHLDELLISPTQAD